MINLKPISLDQLKITGSFWAERQRIVKEVMLPYQYKVLNDEVPDAEPSHALENFRIAAGLSEGEYYGMVFQDSDVAKWLEAVAYVLAKDRDPELEKIADEVVDLIAAAQQPDGYLDTYFIVAHPDKKWTNLREDHELYCAGHMIEAGVAYYEATGKRKILDVVCKLADHIDSVFGTEPGKKRGYPGHEEIELALVKLYRVTNNEKYLKLAQYFVDERGQQPYYFDIEAEQRGDGKLHYQRWGPTYSQSHLPVREQQTAEGHAVRAMYLFSAMADLAKETGDESLLAACRRLWHNVTRRRMYITGGIGASAWAESFSIDYDLPNSRAYTETCAAIGLVFFAHRMLQLELNAEYADVMERALYNGVISGVSLDGKKFFYTNPLEVWPDAAEHRHDHEHIKTTRQGWFRCACCPPNLARLVASLEKYAISVGDTVIAVHLYMNSEANLQISGQNIQLKQKTNYPWDEHITFTISTDTPVEFALKLRIPGWCNKATLKINGENIDLASITEKGYATIARTWQSGDQVELMLAMPVERIQANPKVRMNAGKVALQRGPLVYCLEEVDNGPCLTDICLPKDATFKTYYDENLLGGVTVIEASACRSDTEWDDILYQPAQDSCRKVTIKAIPYYAWNNRGRGEMLVWIRQC